VRELVEHYKAHELNAQPRRMAANTIKVYTINLDTHIVRFWGDVRVADVKTVAVEEWLRTLPLADGTKAKVRNIFSAVFSHAIRHELAFSNPITGPSRGSGVRQNAKRRRDPDVLTAQEIGALLCQLPQQHRALVLIATTGLRFSELRWPEVERPRRPRRHVESLARRGQPRSDRDEDGGVEKAHSTRTGDCECLAAAQKADALQPSRRLDVRERQRKRCIPHLAEKPIGEACASCSGTRRNNEAHYVACLSTFLRNHDEGEW
jgi:hypothetical protein